MRATLTDLQGKEEMVVPVQVVTLFQAKKKKLCRRFGGCLKTAFWSLTRILFVIILRNVLINQHKDLKTMHCPKIEQKNVYEIVKEIEIVTWIVPRIIADIVTKIVQ